MRVRVRVKLRARVRVRVRKKKRSNLIGRIYDCRGSNAKKYFIT